MWATRPLFWFLGAHPPNPLPGGLRPLDPRLPTLVGFGLVSVLGPTRGRVANVDNSPPLLVFGGTSPKPPARGLAPPGLKFGLFEKGLEKGG